MEFGNIKKKTQTTKTEVGYKMPFIKMITCVTRASLKGSVVPLISH